MEGKIIKVLSNEYTVLSDKTYKCLARGNLRYKKLTPLVGDNVIFENNIIKEILPRKNYLNRPLVANIDQCLIIVSVKDPDLDLYLLDKLLCIVEFNNIKPIICFTKLDLLDNNIDEIYNYYSKYYEVYYNTEVDKIKKIFKDKITVLAGQSGAGKSTLINKLTDLNLKTNEISYALGRGKHTTRHVELYNLYEGYLADTPGFSSINFDGMTNTDIKDNMVEFNDYKENCSYRDCMHINEPKCGIKNNKEILLTRYENYLKFIKENQK